MRFRVHGAAAVEHEIGNPLRISVRPHPPDPDLIVLARHRASACGQLMALIGRAMSPIKVKVVPGTAHAPNTGRFIIKRLGAKRFLEPELMATLAQLRKDLLAGIEQPSAADRMMADGAVIDCYNMLRVQGWIGSLCLTVERELFGQAPLSEIHGSTVGNQLAKEIARLENVLMPLVDRCHRMDDKELCSS